MKTLFSEFVKKIFTEKLTKGIKYLILINLVIWLLFYLVNIFLGTDLRYYFSAYPTYSEKFQYYQLLSFMFTHSANPVHVFSNVLFLLIFSASVEKKLGFKLFIINYFLCAWIGYIFINQVYYINKERVEKQIISSGISPKKIPLNDRNEVAENYFLKLNSEQKNAVRKYNFVTSKTSGASGALFGIIIIYILFNIRNYKKIIFTALGLYSIYENISNLKEPGNLINGSSFAHIGGMIGGLIIAIYYYVRKLQVIKN